MPVSNTTGPGAARKPTRRKPRRENVPAPRQQPAGKPVGVFATPIAATTDEATQRTAQRAFQRARHHAENATPAPAVPGVVRVPDVPLNREQRQAVIKHARNISRAARAKGVDVDDAARNGDSVTRDFYAKAAQAARDELHDQLVKLGLQKVKERPASYGLTSAQAQHLHRLAAADRLPEKVRAALASAAPARSEPQLVERAPHGAGATLAAAIDLKPALAASRGLAVTQGALRGARAAANAGTGAFESGSLLSNAAHDVVNLPAETVSSVYHLADEAAQGHVGTVAKDLAAPYVEAVQHPLRSLESHPVNTALLLSGVKAGVGRGSGVVARALPITRDLASVERAPARVPGTALEDVRRYSPDLATKAVQVALERRRTRAADALDRQAGKVGGDAGEAMRSRAAEMRRSTMTPHQIKRRVDYRVDANEQIRRDDRTRATGEAQKSLRGVHAKDLPIVGLVVQGIVKPTSEDLRAYRNEIAAQRDGLGPAKKAANRALVEHIDAALDRGVQWSKIEAAADAYRDVRGRRDAELVGAGIRPASEVERRRLLPYAVRHMDARLLSPEELTRDVVGARKAAQKARGRRVKADAVHGEAEAALAAARGRAAVLSRQVGGVAAERRAEVGAGRFAAGGHGVTQATEALQAAAKARGDAIAAEEAAMGDLRASVRRRKQGSGFVDREGRAVTNDDIRAHMAANGVKEPAYVTQAPNRRGARNFFRNQMEPANAGGASFSGAATREGTLDAHPDTLVEGVANAQSLVSQQHGFARLVTEMGHRKADGTLQTYGTFRQANLARANMEHTADGHRKADAVPMRPVRLNPLGGSRAQLDELLHQADLDETARKGIYEAMDSALSGEHGEGPWALIPAAAADRMREHLRVLGSGGPGKALQVVNQAFRRTVLATSPKWLFGNEAEGALRAAVFRAGPRSWWTAHRSVQALRLRDPEAAAELEARALGGAHFSMAERQKVRRAAEDFEGTRVEPVARALGAFWRAPGPKQTAAVWNRWTDFVFHTVNGRMERQVQKAMLGAAIRRSPLMTGRMRKLSASAIAEAAEGLRNTNTQVAFAREVDRAYGRYGRFSPGERKALALYTPFMAWSKAALEFIGSVLPKDHPVLTSVLASANEATEEWRKEHGLDLFAPGALPGFLQGSIPTGDGGHIPVSRFTPFGAFTSPSETLEGLLLPQLQSSLANLRGEDWKGAKLRVNGQPANEEQRLRAAAGSFLESTVPVLAAGQRLAAGGIGKFVNPVAEVKSKDGAAGAGGGGVDPAAVRAFRRAQQAQVAGPSPAAIRAFQRALATQRSGGSARP